MFNKPMSAAAVALVLTIAGQARAQVMEITVQGVISSTQSFQDIFGAFGPIKTIYPGGTDFTLQYLFDPTLGGRQQINGLDLAYGGTGYPVAQSPVLQVSLTINGLTQILNDTGLGAVGAYAYLNQFQVGAGSSDRFNNLNVQINGTPDDPVLSSLTAPYSWTGLCTGCARGLLTNPHVSQAFFLGDVTSFKLAPELASVPEPAEWALMLAGFFGVGGALRAARRKAMLAA